MKKFLFLTYLLSFSFVAFAKIIPLNYDVINSNISFSFVVTEANNNFIFNTSRNDYEIFEDGNKILDFNFTNLIPSRQSNSSIIFLFDLSLGNLADSSNFLSAIQLMNSIISNSNQSEFAIIAFNYNNYIISDFSTNLNPPINVLYTLKSKLGSNLDTAFLAYQIGAFDFSLYAKYTTSIVLLTDKNRGFDFAKVLSKALERQIKIIPILIGSKISDELRQIALQTRAIYFENAQAQDSTIISKLIDFISKDGEPSKLSWNTLPSCNSIKNELVRYGNKDSVRFNIEINNIDFPKLVANPPFLRYSSVIPFQTRDLDLVLTATNYDIRIDSFRISDPHFTIISGNITQPILLAKNQTHQLRIRFTPTDSSIVFDSLVIYSNACQVKKVNITGGFPNKKPKTRTLNVLNPNCGEQFAIGDTIVISWDGVLPADVVQLQYSTNGGASWDTLAENVLGLQYRWWLNPMKFRESDSCLVRIIQIWPNNAGEVVELRHLSSVNFANFNRDASLLITASSQQPQLATIWHTGTGKKLFDLVGHRRSVNWASFDDNDRYAITGSDDSTVIVWDIKTGDSVFSVKAHSSKVTSVNFSPDGNYFLTTGTDGACYVWGLETKKIVATIAPPSINPIYYANFTPDSNFIIYASYDGNLYCYDLKQLKVTNIYTTKYPNNHIHHFSVYPTKKLLAAASHLGLIFIFDYFTEPQQDKIPYKYLLWHDSTSYPAINTSFFNSNGNWLITAGSDSRVLRWNPSTGELIDSIAIGEHTSSITSAQFSFDDAMLVTSSWDSTVKIFNRTKLGLQIDTSDCFFSIVKPKLDHHEIAFGKVPVGSSADSIIVPLVRNLTNMRLSIKKLRLEGANSDEFQILDLSNYKFIEPNDSLSAIISFIPKQSGIRRAKIKIVYDGDSTEINLEGNGFIPPLTVSPQIIDMGKVEIGEYKDTLLTRVVRNESKANVNIYEVTAFGPDSLNFVIINGAEPKTLLPNDSYPITIRFTPDTVGRRICLFAFKNDSEAEYAFLHFFAEGIRPVFDTLVVSVGTHYAEVGELISIPIKISNQVFQHPNSKYEGIAFDFKFNKTILEPLDKEYQSTIDDTSRTIFVKVYKNNLDDSNLVTLHFRVGLGNDTATKLTISNAYPLGYGKMFIHEKSGKLFIKNICKEGGPRLFESDGKFFLSESKPNPATTLASFDFETIETGVVSLEIYNFDGVMCKNVLKEYLKAGKYEISFSVEDLPSGIYLCVLKTPNQIKTKTLQVVR